MSILFLKLSYEVIVLYEIWDGKVPGMKNPMHSPKDVAIGEGQVPGTYLQRQVQLFIQQHTFKTSILCIQNDFLAHLNLLDESEDHDKYYLFSFIRVSSIFRKYLIQ